MAKRQKNRLAEGGCIDRSKPLAFEFNGRKLQGFAGDTIASALLANGISTVSRSFKYHRPRGVFSAGVEESGGLLTVTSGNGDIPIVRSTLTALAEGKIIRSQNCFPSVNFDLGRSLDFSHRLWSTGFYNKTFKWPHWRWYEATIRRLAGLGKLASGEDNTGYFHHNLHCDVLIVGAGPAGLAAALSAANSGARVVLAEQEHEVGGSLLRQAAEIDGLEPDPWIAATLATLRQSGNVTVMTSSTVCGYYDHNVLTIADRSDAGVKRFWKVRTKQVVLATGAIEQPLVFCNNDRPGIMLAASAMAYVHRYGVRPCASMLVATNNDSAYAAAFSLHDHGVQIPAIVDVRENIAPALVQQADQRGIPIMPGSVIIDTAGFRRLSKARIGRLSKDAQTVLPASRWIRCSGIAMSGGFNPTLHLYSQAGGKLHYNVQLACFLTATCAQQVLVAGAANGRFLLPDALAESVQAGAQAAGNAGFECRPVAISTSVAGSYALQANRISPAGDTHRQWVDWLHDVTVADIEQAAQENFVSVEHMKRYTSAGMSVDQGKTSNLNALTLLAGLTDKPIEEVGTTTFRPQFMPLPMGVIAGQRRADFYQPARLLPAHDWHLAKDAVFEDYGAWRRPEYYAGNGKDRAEAIRAEVLSVRRNAGLFDGSPLGKIEVKGPDAGDFLNRIYVNNIQTLKTGHIRYGLMLNENGIIIDDGVCARLEDELYLLSTTAANADRIGGWLEEWHQCEWPHLELLISPVTSQWAVITIAGPDSRYILQSIDSDIDFSAESLPHMSLSTGVFAGVDARVQRVSFSGEMSFEISVAAKHGQTVIEHLLASSAHLKPVGIEAILVLRTEKGYLHVGADTDGTSNALDVGFAGIVAKKQTDFVGKRSLLRARDQSAERRQLVGIEAVDKHENLQAGAHFVTTDGAAQRSEGMVTSACYSPTLQRIIGLGMLEKGFARKGETVTVFDAGRTFSARITDPVFYDPAGERLHA